MKVNWIVLLLSIAVFISCKPKTELELRDEMIQNVPDSVLSVEDMISVVADIQLAESWAVINKSDSLSQDTRLVQYYAQIFKMHNTDVKKYQSSYNYYSNEPVLMDYIYQEVTDKLNILDSENLNVKKPKKDE